MEQETFEAITTQEQFDAQVAPLLQAERDKFSDYADLQRKAGLVDGLQAQVSDLTAQVAALRNEALQRQIAHEEGLPYELANRLTGKDERELRADAQALAKFVARKPAKAPPLHDPEGEQTDSTRAALKEVLGKIRKE